MTTPTVTVLKRGAARLEAGHVWIYKSDVKHPPALRGGDEVRCVDEGSKFLGTALYSIRSQITLRMLSSEDKPAEEIIAERLRLALDLRSRLYADQSAMRLVHSEGDWLPGLIVDRYGSTLVIQTLTEAMDRRQKFIVDLLVDLTGATSVVARNDVPSRKHEGLAIEKAVIHGPPPGLVEYREGEIKLLADPLEGQKTGAFLDQRENHLLAGQLAHGRALDCFSYIGGFAMQMAARATKVVAVDSSEKAVADLNANIQRNGLTNVETKTANAFDYLREHADARERYDTIVLDPPAFTKSRDSIEPALRGYKEINLRALSMLKPGGLLVTSSCSFHIDEAAFAGMLLAAAHDAKRRVQILERRGAAKDHPELMGVPETKYLKCYFVRAL